MIKALHVSPDVFAALTKALLDHEAGTGRFQLSSNPALDILYASSPLLMEEAERITASTDPIPTIVIWNWKWRAEIIEG